MKGVFIRKNFNIWLAILFLCGLFFIGMYIFLNIVDSEADSELLAFLIFGILICLCAAVSLMLNFGAFFYIDEDSIHAKYHWFGKIDCKISDVFFASANSNTLNIQLKNGKRHTIMGIENSWKLCSVIRRNMSFETNEQPKKLIEDLNKLILARKKGGIYVFLGVAFMLINIFVTVFLTGERELEEFSKIDWTILAVMSIIEIATTIVTFYFAQKTGKCIMPIDQTKYAIQRTMIETQPLSPDYIISVYADEDYSGRIIIFGSPQQDAVYYSVQEFDAEYNLVDRYISDIYEDKEKLPEGFKDLIDITEKVLH